MGSYIAFFVGVCLADWLALYPNLKRAQIYLRAIPVGLVVVSTMLMAATATHVTESGTEKYYGHTDSIPEYLLFMGTVMFFGTLVPDTFDVLRNRFHQTSSEAPSRINEYHADDG